MYLFLYCVLSFFMFFFSGRWDVALSASFVLECFDGNEVTTRKGNEPVV